MRRAVAATAPARPSILIVPSGSVTVQEDLGGGRPAEGRLPPDAAVAAARPSSWRSRTGTCQQIVLEDVAGLQEKTSTPVDTSQIRLSIVDAYPPATDQPDDEISMTEIRLFERG